MKIWQITSGANAGANATRAALRLTRSSLMRALLLFPAAAICLMAFFASSARAQYSQTNLVSNTKLYSPLHLDPNLIDSWGLAALPDSPWWLSAQNTSSSTLYTANGSIVPLVVEIPCVISNATGATTVPCPFPGEGYIDEPNNPTNPKTNTGIGFGIFGPTGIVANSFSNAFEVGGAPAQFIFATQDGLIVAWNKSLSPMTQAVVVVNRFSAPALYQGLAIAGPAGDPHLYATNAAGGIEVFDRNFKMVNSFAADSNVPSAIQPAGPYGIQAIGDKLYVTYFSIVVSAGILDVCDLNSSPTKPKCHRLFASNLTGTENAPILASPWGIALAPDDFGPLCDKLLVGNVDDGLINAFDPASGYVIGTLNLNDGSRFSVPGLWGLQFGQGKAANGPRNHLFFSSGPSPVNITDSVQQYGAGLFGVITPPNWHKCNPDREKSN
jgi:uncharacterized protein (TIGR03118 family)